MQLLKLNKGNQTKYRNRILFVIHKIRKIYFQNRQFLKNDFDWTTHGFQGLCSTIFTRFMLFILHFQSTMNVKCYFSIHFFYLVVFSKNNQYLLRFVCLKCTHAYWRTKYAKKIGISFVKAKKHFCNKLFSKC